MRHIILAIMICGCDAADDLNSAFRQAPEALQQAPDKCAPSFTLTLTNQPDGWLTVLRVVNADCGSTGAGWIDDAPDCDAIADAARDSCEQL